ncbi:MAG: HNH endonuclease, partial [Gemmatimonadota bacterium]
EYRVQVTGIDTGLGFLLDGAEKILILGWWADADVFAGFDFKKHSGPLGSSPSIQIREEALRLASIRGLATHDKGSGEIAVAFKPEFFPEYVRDLERLHGFGESAEDRAALERVAEHPEAPPAGEVSPERQTVLLTIAKKLRDNSFKSRVLYAYGSQCAFCDVQLKLVEAAHILPVAVDGSDETSNGLALCSLHHRAFDRALVTLNERYQILLNEQKLAELRSWGLDRGEGWFREHLRAVVRVPPTASDRPDLERIHAANQLRGW